MTRGRRKNTGVEERAWAQRHRELLAREREQLAQLPAMPDPKDNVRAYLDWVQKHGRIGLSPEWQTLYDDLRSLPRQKYQRERDRETWGWISYLLMCQGMGAPYDLMTCSLGTNPWNYKDGALPPGASKAFRYLLDTLIGNGHVDVWRDPLTGEERRRPMAFPLRPNESAIERARRLYDAIRKWRADRRQLTR